MSLIKRFKDAFKFTDDVDLNRRKVIKTAGALAALTVVGSVAPSLVTVSRLQKKIDSGLIIGETFYLTEPIIIDIPNVVIRNCSFIAVNPMDYMLIMEEGAVNCIIQNCYFEAKYNITAGIKVLSQQGDMTVSMQSAIDSVSSIYLAPGEYKIDSPLIIPPGSKWTGKA